MALMQIGFIGFGKMGTRMVEKLLSDGHTVVGWNRTRSILDEFRLVLHDKKLDEHFIAADDIKNLISGLNSPRVIWIMLPAGEATENALQEVAKHVEKGDIVVDGGNSFYKDTQRRYEDFKEYGVRYLGIGVSGGVKAVDTGYPLMVGGDSLAFEEIKPLLETLIKPGGPARNALARNASHNDASGTHSVAGGGYEYFGEGGAGHFVKMVHNGIEYGMMQAIGEGFGVLEKAPYELDLQKVSQLWQKNTIVTSFLMECAKDALQKDPTLLELDGVIDANGEAEWTVAQAKEENVFAENIEQSLDFRRRSKIDTAVSSSFAARMVAALRHEFGGHKVKEK